jgi:sugar fermentation stimulation protein A
MNNPVFAPALPPEGGVNVLVLRLPESACVTVGRLGACALPAGWLLYVGSAMNGLAGRVGRHARANKRLHWHIDHVLQVAPLQEVWCHVGLERLECDWARLLAAQPGLALYPRPLGASDCACFTHLLCSPETVAVKEAFQMLQQRWPCQRHVLWTDTAGLD